LSRQQSSYAVRLAPGGQTLQWVLIGAKPEVVLSTEPEVTPLYELGNALLAPFVPEQLL